jgi:hypothetical protein
LTDNRRSQMRLVEELISRESQCNQQLPFGACIPQLRTAILPSQ